MENQGCHSKNRIRSWKAPAYSDVVSEKARHFDLLLQRYNGLDWIVKLKDHTSCVNALAFSSKGGRWLASGGDDLRILLWDQHETQITKPSHTFTGPRRNIFELAFTANNNYLLCGGVDSAIRRYDFQRVGEASNIDPIHTFLHHNDSIRGISPHITNDELYITASEDGTLFYHDARSPVPVNHLISRHGWVGVQFHPRLEHLFLGGTDRGRGRITLFDVRKCFGQGYDIDNRELMRYAVQAIGEKPISSSLCDLAFDQTGERFATVNQGHFPTVYSISDPYPIAVCTAERLPSGDPVLPLERTYGNSCTIKHVSFGGPSLYGHGKGTFEDTDQFLATGSDDFRGYVWRLPPTSYLLAKREEMEDDNNQWECPRGRFGYIMSALDDTLRLPVTLNQPAFRLGGHQSIVNSAKWHPELPRIATCGIESKVVLHDCAPVVEGAVKVDSSTVRKRSSRLRTRPRMLDAHRVITGEVTEDISSDENRSTILYFDSTLANDEVMERRSRSISINLDDADSSGEELRGGSGNIPESDELLMSYHNRERIMALFARLLARSASREAVDDGLSRMLGMIEDGEEQEEHEREGDDEEDDNMSVEMPE